MANGFMIGVKRSRSKFGTARQSWVVSAFSSLIQTNFLCRSSISFIARTGEFFEIFRRRRRCIVSSRSGVVSWTWVVRKAVDVLAHLAVGAGPLAGGARLRTHERALGLQLVQLVVDVGRRHERFVVGAHRTAGTAIGSVPSQSGVADWAAAMAICADLCSPHNAKAKSHTNVHMHRQACINVYQKRPTFYRLYNRF